MEADNDRLSSHLNLIKSETDNKSEEVWLTAAYKDKVLNIDIIVFNPAKWLLPNI